ncbi:hypothetical protein DY000_02020085 [Brassica cretica]|uniref:Uncharacterized protein n=1 Tax=Brassica cretica TaxID=69181 RepID=A0ABQ7EL08_BRACR|nr:hypothetical protein DY000_02020085 [Brassica cretica]
MECQHLALRIIGLGHVRNRARRESGEPHLAFERVSVSRCKVSSGLAGRSIDSLIFACEHPQSWIGSSGWTMVRGDAPARSYDLKTSVSWSKTWLRESDSWNLTKIRQRQAQRSWTSELVAGRGPGQLPELDGLSHSAGSAGDQLNSSGLRVQVLGSWVGSGQWPDHVGDRVCRWAGGVLGLSQGHGKSMWASVSHVQEWFDSSRASGEKGEGQTPLSMAWTALKADVVQKSVSWEFKGRDEQPLHGSYHY